MNEPTDQYYNPYADPNIPPCNCADWGMMGCFPSCQRQKYIVNKIDEYERKRKENKESK